MCQLRCCQRDYENIAMNQTCRYKQSKTIKNEVANMSNEGQIYVSVTGLWLKNPWHIFNFIYYAIPSKI